MQAKHLYARLTEGYDERVQHARSLLQASAREHAERIVQASSLGAEDMVITHLIASLGLPIPVATLDTGALHRETLDLVPTIRRRYGVTVSMFAPQHQHVVSFVRTHGEWAMRESVDLRKRCCGLRKLEPLSRMLQGRTAWVTGLRREQSDARGDVMERAHDAEGRIKLSPLAEWSWSDVWHFIATNDVPYNPLHDAHHPSIGCAPCTRAIAVGEPFRAGRWWWEDDGAKECGLHPAHVGARAHHGATISVSEETRA